MRRFALPITLALLFAALSVADEPRPTLDEAVRKAVAARQLQDSDNLGDGSARAPFREVNSDGAVLVGLEVGLGRWLDTEVVYAIRPIYRQGGREWAGAPAGNLYADNVRRRVRVVAKPGYAVGGMWLRTGAGIDRLRLQFMRVRDGHLDRTDSYASDWVGKSDGGIEKYIDGGGLPVVGLFAETGREQARNFGLVYARVSLPQPKPKAPPVPPEGTQPKADSNEVAESEPGKKSNLEMEAEARIAREASGGVSTVVIILILVAVVGVPLAVIGYYLLGQKEPLKGTGEPIASEKPKKPTQPSQPVNERPGLAKRLQPYLPAASTTLTTASMAKRSSEPPPPYFLVRATYRARRDRMTRIYVLPGELLVIDAGPGADHNLAAGFAAAAATGGGFVGAFVGGQVASMVADTQKAGGEVLQWRLDQLDLPGLVACAAQEGNFRARFEDVAGITIEPPGVSNNSRAIGTLRFRHLRRGEYAFEFLSGAEIRGAVELLRRNATSNNIHVGSGWDQATAVYLDGL